MSKLVYVISLLVLALSMEVYAQRHNEFAGIPFGLKRETVIDSIAKMGYEPRTSLGREEIPVFQFGELQVQVYFSFNDNGKFYAFEIRTNQVEEANKAKVFKDIEYISQQFTLKYGQSSGNPTVNETNLQEGLNHYQEWLGVKILNADTYIHKIGKKYHVVGIVKNRELANEKGPKKDQKEKKKAEPVF